jgi:hypothetical protein
MKADRRLAESLEKSPPKSWNADLKRRMMEADRRRVDWPEKSLERRRVEAAERRAKAARSAVTADSHAMLERKYVRAASRPWLSVEPDPPPPEHELYLTGIYWAERGQHAAALTAYEEAIKSEPDGFLALDRLAWLLATCPEDRIRDGKWVVELANRRVRTNHQGRRAGRSQSGRTRLRLHSGKDEESGEHVPVTIGGHDLPQIPIESLLPRLKPTKGEGRPKGNGA